MVETNIPSSAVSDMDAVIVHDFMETYGGAERVTAEIARAFPRADVVALLGRGAVAQRMGIADRWSSILPERQHLLDGYRVLAPLFPAISRLSRVRSTEAVISSSYAFAHGVRSKNDAPRVCYCHSPLRFAWTMTDDYAHHWAPGPARAAFDGLAAAMRVADRRAARGVARYLTQSPFTAEQIRTSYGKRAEVIGAPVDTELFRPATSPQRGDYFLLCGRLIEPYKRPGIVVDAFRSLGQRLMVVGDGPALAELRRSAPPNVSFVGALDDAGVVQAMQNSIAGIFPSRDDFGLIPVEFMACGRPVIAFAEGGALHTVNPEVSGTFLKDQTATAIVDAIRAFDPADFDAERIRAHAMQWDARAFRERLVRQVADVVTSGG